MSSTNCAMASNLRHEGTGLGDRCRPMLEDIANLTGGQTISEDLGIKLELARRSRQAGHAFDDQQHRQQPLA